MYVEETYMQNARTKVLTLCPSIFKFLTINLMYVESKTEVLLFLNHMAVWHNAYIDTKCRFI